MTRRRHDDETTQLRDVVRKLHGERDEARKERDAFQSAARTAAEKYVVADATNRRLDGRVRELTRRLDARGDLAQQRGADLGRLNNRLGHAEAEFHHIDSYAARMEVRLDRALRGAARWMTAVWSRDRRIAILQQQLDATRTNLVASQARVAELHEQLTKAEAAADPRPVHGGARYPQPSNELRAAKAHAAALDRRLSEVTAANANCKCGAA
ncbi:hypothetical protein [Streptomyces tendae]|uniref:hypothetical protein n=1 Tax=Streptomyces tendae TaxID=1932 RepID=UPI00340312DE